MMISPVTPRFACSTAPRFGSSPLADPQRREAVEKKLDSMLDKSLEILENCLDYGYGEASNSTAAAGSVVTAASQLMASYPRTPDLKGMNLTG